MMNNGKVTSKDGTPIAYDRYGEGPAVILVGGAFQHRRIDPQTRRLAGLLAPRFSVYHYDRRGRGDSGDTLPYAVAREIEDIEALIEAAGGPASLFGISSGAALAFEAALALGGKVRKLAMYEAPYNDDADARQAWREYRKRLAETLAAGRRGDAVGLFMMLVGATPDQVDQVRRDPSWPDWEAVAPTLAYDAAALAEDASIPAARAAGLAMPALLMAGDASEWSFMPATAKALAEAIPNARLITLEGQSHDVDPEALAPVLAAFFAA